MIKSLTKKQRKFLEEVQNEWPFNNELAMLTVHWVLDDQEYSPADARILNDCIKLWKNAKTENEWKMYGRYS